MKQIYWLRTGLLTAQFMALLFAWVNYPHAHAQLNGAVFLDYDLNSLHSGTSPTGPATTEITGLAFVDPDEISLTTVTNDRGNYSLANRDAPVENPLCIKSLNLPMEDYTGPYSSNSSTSIQLIKAPVFDVSVGLKYPFDNSLGVYSCPELISDEDTILACSGQKIFPLGVRGLQLNPEDSVRFVVFTSPQSGTAMYGPGGVVIGTVKPNANNRAELPNPNVNTTNNSSSVATRYIYAIIYPTPQSPDCRPAYETMLLIKPPVAASATGGLLNCAVTQVNLPGSAHNAAGDTVTSNVIYSWRGPDGFTTAEQNPIVSVAGTYTLTVTTLSCLGQRSSALAVVTADTARPDLIALGSGLPCASCTSTLYAEAPEATLRWNGPGGFTSTVAEPEVSIPGTYTVTATGANGCQADVTVELLPVDQEPCLPITALAVGGTVSCAVAQVSLQAEARNPDGAVLTSNLIYNWRGPNGFTSAEQNPVVSAAGSYSLTISLVDCPDMLATALAVVAADTARPELIAYGGALPCRGAGCTSTVYAEAPGVGLLWNGPGSFTSTEVEPVVTLPGEYTITATGTNGCEISQTVEVLPADQDPCADSRIHCVPFLVKLTKTVRRF
ncbi:hypothetical protein GCM10027341_32910 [Spirosoma knui]